MRFVRRQARRITIRTKLATVTALLIAVIAGVIVFSARSTSIDRQRALVDNVAGRQPTLVHRYVEEVLLVSQGGTADPEATKATLVHDADALLDGGAVLAVQGNDEQIHIPAQTDAKVRAKLDAFRTMVAQLIESGDRVAHDKAGTTEWQRDAAATVALGRATANVGHDAVGRMTTHAEQAVRANSRKEMALAVIGIILALAISWLLGRRLVQRLRSLAGLVAATAAGDFGGRYDGPVNDEVGLLGAAFNDVADNLSRLLNRLEADAERDGFGSQLMEAFEMADEEGDAHAIVERAMNEISATAPMELLLADSSRAHLERVASSPLAGSPGCPVESPFNCVAVRRGSPAVFETSGALNACSKLRDRPGGPCSAVCVPVTFMGKALGVLHAVGPDGVTPTAEQVGHMTTLAAQAGSRIGTVRAFHQTQLQATTDGLTGLLNRRSLENELRAMLADNEPFALAMADLDHFKNLNDTFGHEGGDRALRLFARTMQGAVRANDIVARYGGEEFVFVFPGQRADKAAELIERLRVVLAGVLGAGDVPIFTASFGVTDTEDASTIDELLRRADEALMEAKAAGRDRVLLAGATKPAV